VQWVVKKEDLLAREWDLWKEMLLGAQLLELPRELGMEAMWKECE
jgi:hypothetical protein